MPTAVPQWSPFQTYVWSGDELAAWYDQNGNWGFYNGLAWEPVVKQLPARRFSIKFKEYKPCSSRR